MPRPTVSDAAEAVYAALDPAMTYGDEDLDWPLLKYVDAIVTPLSLVWEIADTSWEDALDPDTAPATALDWLGQFVGVQPEEGRSEEDTRNAIKVPAGFGRGRPAAIIAAAEATLTGTKTVLMTERFGGDAYALDIQTLSDETPDEGATHAAILRQKPAGIILTYAAGASRDWDDLDADYSSWDDVETAYDSWDELEAHD